MAAFAPSMLESSRSAAVQGLNLGGLHARGIRGLGIRVAVLDSGLNLAHTEFSGSGRIVGAWNVNGSTDVTDATGHGTHVAGIIAAAANGSGMYGVAPEATLIPVKIFNTATASSSDINRGLSHAVTAGARIVNLSLGATGPTGDSTLRGLAAGNRTLVVAAAGNTGAAHPIWPARYAKEPWAKGTIIAVGAMDANGQIAAFSNRAGDTAHFYLVAPGTSVLSSYGSGYASLSGTSVAAPVVSGAAALLWSHWPYLQASQVSAILLNTADDLGAPGIDPIYGHGLLNVNRALAPVGSFTYRAANGRQVTIPLTQRPVSTSPLRVASPTVFRALSTQVFDAYGRNFTSEEGEALSVRTATTVDMLLGRMDAVLDSAERALGRGMHLTSWTARPASALSGRLELTWNRPAAPLGSLVKLQQHGGLGFAAGSGGVGSLALGLMDSPLAPALAGADRLVSHPMLGFAPDHRFAALSAPLAGNWHARLGIVQSKTVSSQEGPAADVQLVELTYSRRDLALNVSLADLSERGLLGGYSHAGLGLQQSTHTRGLSFSLAWRLAEHWTAAGSYSVATTGAPESSGLLEGGTTIRSDAFGLGLIKADTWRPRDRLSFMLHAPLRARSGTLTYSVVDHVTEDGTPVYREQRVDLRGSARELVAETRYQLRLGPQAWLTAAAAWRHHPDHDAQARPETIVGLRYTLAF